MPTISSFFLSLAIMVFSANAFAQRTVHAVVEFGDGVSELTSAVSAQLNQLLASQPEGWTIVIDLVTETQYKRSYASAAELSKKRCQAVERHFIESGISPSYIMIHRANGRYPAESFPATDPQRYDYTGVYSIDVNRMRSFVRGHTARGIDPLQATSDLRFIYQFDNTASIIVDHPHGALLTVPAFAFETKDGSVIDAREITLEWYLFTTIADMLRADLVTMSGPKLLETGGMAFIRAKAGDKELRLKPGVALNMAIQTVAPQENMHVFYGEPDDNIIDWRLDPESEVQAQGIRQESGQEGWTPTSSEQESSEGKLIYDTTYSEDLLTGELIQTIFPRPYTKSYDFMIRDLGWINCDRFTESDQKIDLAVTLDRSTDSLAIRMVFHDIRSILAAEQMADSAVVQFHQIPSAGRVTILAYGRQNGEYCWSRLDTDIEAAADLRMSLEVVTEQMLEERLKGFQI